MTHVSKSTKKNECKNKILNRNAEELLNSSNAQCVLNPNPRFKQIDKKDKKVKSAVMQ